MSTDTKKKSTSKKIIQYEVERLPHKIEFNLGQKVYIKTDEEQLQRMVTGLHLRPDHSIIYNISHETRETDHYGIELSAERDVLLATGTY